MGKHNWYTYEVKFQNEGYEYITSNAEFYGFRGKMLYSTFDKLLTENSKELLEKLIGLEYHNRPFILELFNQEKSISPMFCTITEDSSKTQTMLHMVEVDKMFNEYLSLMSDHEENYAILSQLDDVYYSYDKSTDTITCFIYADEKTVISREKLQDWQNNALDGFDDESGEKLLKLVSKLRNGDRSFIYVFSGRNEKENIRITGTAIYKGDTFVKTVGTIENSNIKPIQDTARRDQLTGLFMKEDITNYAKRSLGDLNRKIAMAVIDIDDFKLVNDRFGHSMGDAVLKKCAAIIADQLGSLGKAGRIGGDEFYIVVEKFADIETLRDILRGIKNNVAKAYADEIDGFHITTSIGVSVFPDDGEDFNTLFNLADHMLYRAKSKGKNRYIIYDKEKHGTVEEILQTEVEKAGFVGRRGLSKSEVVCQIAEWMLLGKDCPLEKILSNIVEFFEMDRIALYNLTDKILETSYQSRVLDGTEQVYIPDYLYDKNLKEYYNGDFMVVNNTDRFITRDPQIYEILNQQGLFSLIQTGFTLGEKEYVVSYESVTKHITWNTEDLYLYRILNKILEKCLERK